MSNKITAIYVRRSVSDERKGNNSFSIATQQADCIAYVQEHYPDEKYEIFIDNGKSGKDIQHRPKFMEMMKKAREGDISRIVVKKIDRFSRNLGDSIVTIDELGKLGVGFASVDQQIDLETPSGKMAFQMMLVFAQSERETIAARNADNYDIKARTTGFFQGGRGYFGYITERRTINGKTGSVLVPSPQANAIRIAFSMYQRPGVSVQDVFRYYRENGVDAFTEVEKGKTSCFFETSMAKMLKNPLYVRANADIYRYLAALGYKMMDDISAYDGVHGVFVHGKSGEEPFAKVGYHEGLVDADTWLAVQDKKAHLQKYPGKPKAQNSWLVGMVKCPHCGYAFTITKRQKSNKTYRYFRDEGYRSLNRCVRSTSKYSPDEVEDTVFQAMKERLNSLEIARKKKSKPNPKIAALTSEIVEIDKEIDALMEKLAMANTAFFLKIQERVTKLDERKSELEQELQKLQRRTKAVDTAPLAEPLARWDELTVQEKHDVAATMIEVVYLSDENGIDIHFSI